MSPFSVRMARILSRKTALKARLHISEISRKKLILQAALRTSDRTRYASDESQLPRFVARTEQTFKYP